MEEKIRQRFEKINGAYQALAVEINGLYTEIDEPITPAVEKVSYKEPKAQPTKKWFGKKQKMPCNNATCSLSKNGECTHKKQLDCSDRVQ